MIRITPPLVRVLIYKLACRMTFAFIINLNRPIKVQLRPKHKAMRAKTSARMGRQIFLLVIFPTVNK